MKIGLIQVDGKWPNLALMKISTWHKAQGDEVEFFMPISQYDLVYASKIFTWSQDYQYYPDSVVMGGTGYYDSHPETITSDVLPPEVEAICPDYDLYRCDYALGYTSRGCFRRCPWCIVWRKEGDLHPVGDIYDFWRGQRIMRLLDGNILGLPTHFEEIAKQIIKERIICNFTQGLDIRLMTSDVAKLLSKIRPEKQYYFAWDRPQDEESIVRGLEILRKNGVPLYKVTIYVLVGYDTTPDEDLHRVTIIDRFGAIPFVMPYDKREKYQRDFARWVNHRAIFKSCSFLEYAGGNR